MPHFGPLSLQKLLVFLDLAPFRFYLNGTKCYATVERRPMPESATLELAQAYEITPLGEDQWKVRIPAFATTLVDRKFMEHLREAKKVIASQFSAPFELLEFREILAREKTPDGVIISLLIGRLKVGQGKTILRLKPAKSPTGELFEDMIAEVDFHYLDEFGKAICREALLAAFEKWGLARELLEMSAVEGALRQVLERRSYVTNLVVAQGKFPECGQDAEFEYTFFTEPDAAANLREYQVSRKVKSGDILCQKTPPTKGKVAGMTVRGEALLPQKGLDFQLLPGAGGKLSLDGLRLSALRDGLAVMKRKTKKVYTSAGEKIVPASIEISVQELVSLDGGTQLNINADHSIEIKGDLKEGSTISTQGEVLLTGNVGRGSLVAAGLDILIEGTVQGAQITSEGSIRGNRKVDHSTIHAEGDIVINDAAENSELTGDTVSVIEALGCNIQARRKVSLGRVRQAEGGRKTVIRVGRGNFYAQKLESELKEINTLSSSLEKLQSFFGKEILERLTHDNLQSVILKELKRRRQMGYGKLAPDQAQAIKILLESFKPMKGVLAEKNDEILNLRKKASEDDAEKAVVVIREKLSAPIEVTIDSDTESVGPTETGVVVTSGEGRLTTQSFTADKPSETPSNR